MRRLVLVCAVVIALVSTVAAPAQAATLKVLKNPDFEKQGCGDGLADVLPKSWVRGGGATAVCWAAGGGFPIPTDPGPPDRATAFVSGGNGFEVSTLTQTRSVASVAAPIDAGTARFNASAWLGGFGAQDDQATVTISWKDAAGNPIGLTAALGPVNAAMRNDLTALLLRKAKGTVPVGARSVIVVITFVRDEGAYNDGYADSLDFKVTTP